jgi:hypothetical protein
MQMPGENSYQAVVANDRSPFPAGICADVPRRNCTCIRLIVNLKRDRPNRVTGPSFCTKSSETVYIKVMGCDIGCGGTWGLQAASGVCIMQLNPRKLVSASDCVHAMKGTCHGWGGSNMAGRPRSKE